MSQWPREPIGCIKPLALCLLLVAIAGCGGGSSSSSSTKGQSSASITIQVPSSPVLLGQTAQFTAVVQNLSNNAVTWEVNSITGGNTAVGTISNTGLYTAPTTIPTPNNIQITAVSAADPSLMASATIALSSNIMVSVSPQTASVIAGLTQQFSVALQNAINVAVTWEVNGVAGGTSTEGFISSGLYTAPENVPNPGSVTVTAVSVADPSKFASARVTITPPVSVSVSPIVATVFTGKTLQFDATVQGTGNTSVTWQVCCEPPEVSGSISNSGLYTAPPSASGLPLVVMTATSLADPTKSGNATIVLNSPSTNNTEVKGQYAFNFTTLANDAVPEASLQAGSLVADGTGTITSGTMDFVGVAASTKIVDSVEQVIGAYSVGADGQGELVLLSVDPTSLQRFRCSLALGSFRQGIANRAHLSGPGPGALILQNTAALSTSAIQGDYAFGTLVGSGTEGVAVLEEALAGRFHADGGGNLSSGHLDASDIGGSLELSDAPFGGTYSLDANSGRGTATLEVPTVGTFNMVFYAISAAEMFWLGTTPNSGIFSGSALRQSGGPFSEASLHGTSVFAFSGASLPGLSPLQSLGLITADGGGNVTGSVDGIEDSSHVVMTNQPFNGTYTVETIGRGTLKIFNQNFVLYIVSENSAFVLEAPNNLGVQTGLIEPQAAGPFSDASLTGSFTSGGNGSSLDETIGFTPSNVFGTYSSNGTGNITGSFTATYSISANGRGTMEVPSVPGSVAFYLVLPKAFIALDSTGVLPPGFPSLSFFGP